MTSIAQLLPRLNLRCFCGAPIQVQHWRDEAHRADRVSMRVHDRGWEFLLDDMILGESRDLAEDALHHQLARGVNDLGSHCPVRAMEIEQLQRAAMHTLVIPSSTWSSTLDLSPGWFSATTAGNSGGSTYIPPPAYSGRDWFSTTAGNSGGSTYIPPPVYDQIFPYAPVPPTPAKPAAPKLTRPQFGKPVARRIVK